MRRFVGLPLAFLLELHGWYVSSLPFLLSHPSLVLQVVREVIYDLLTIHRWHIFTAMGGYVAVAIVDVITSGEVHEDCTGYLAWPIPFLARFVKGMLRLGKKD